MDKPDYYEILGIGRDASLEQIKNAFRSQALRWHPDRNQGDPTSEKRFKAAAEAYEVLREPEKRDLYDSERDHKNTGAAFSGFGHRGKRGRGCGGRRCARSSRHSSRKGGWSGSFREHMVEVALDPSEATNGCEREITCDSVLGRTTLLLHFPPGLYDGDVVRLTGIVGEGYPGLGKDIYLRISVAPMSEETREGSRLR